MSASFDPTLLGKIASYTEILTKDPRSTVFVSLSDAYRQMGMLEDALEVAKNGVAALPRYSPGLVHLGRVQFEMGDLDGALASLETAHALDGGSLSALRGLARVLLAKGDKVRARQLLEKGATLHPGDAGLRKMLAALPAPRGAAGTPGGRGEAPIATPTIAEIYLKQGLPERALQVYRDLLRVNPEDQSLRRKLAELQQKLLQENAPAPAAAPAVAAPPAAEPSPVAPATVAAVAPPATAPIAAPAAGPDPAERQLAELERWLAAIRTRREHVR